MSVPSNELTTKQQAKADSAIKKALAALLTDTRDFLSRSRDPADSLDLSLVIHACEMLGESLNMGLPNRRLPSLHKIALEQANNKNKIYLENE